METLNDQKHMREYTKALVAGGLSKRKIQDHLRKSRSQLSRQIRLLRSKKSKEKMTRFFAVPFFVAIGKK